MVSISAKCSDMFTSIVLDTGKTYDGYVPEWAGPDPAGGGDYIEMTICRHCGQVQGKWPEGKPAPECYKWGKVS